MSQQEIIHAYRHLLRQGLRAIQFSKPARFTLRNRIRVAFSKGCVSDFDSARIANTLELLQHATRENGLEHKILKNLLLVWWGQDEGGRTRPSQKAVSHEELRLRTTAFDAFNHNIDMLNASMNTCIPAMTLRDPV